jgi:hypothetical protein
MNTALSRRRRNEVEDRLAADHRHGKHRDPVRECPECAITAFNRAYVATFGYEAAMRELERSNPK